MELGAQPLVQAGALELPAPAEEDDATALEEDGSVAELLDAHAEVAAGALLDISEDTGATALLEDAAVELEGCSREAALLASDAEVPAELERSPADEAAELLEGAAALDARLAPDALEDAGGPDDGGSPALLDTPARLDESMTLVEPPLLPAGQPVHVPYPVPSASHRWTPCAPPTQAQPF